jgi:polyhydroxyalkanoate synthase
MLMSEQKHPEFNAPDPAEVGKTMTKVAEQSARIVTDFLARQKSGNEGPYNVLDIGVIGRTFQEFTQKVIADPAKVIEAQMKFWTDSMALWQSTTQRVLGQGAESVALTESGDKRFKADEWDENPVFDYIKQSYLLAAQYAHACVSDVEGLDDKTAQKVKFYTRQFVDAMAPTNFVMTNPQVLRTTMETGG